MISLPVKSDRDWNTRTLAIKHWNMQTIS